MIVLCFTSIAISQQRGTFASAPVAIEKAIDSLLARMTPLEKAGQLHQLSARGGELTGRGKVADDEGALIRAGKIGSFLNVRGSAATHALQRIAVEESRLKIPLLFGLDVIHGYTTTFPIPLGMAATWEPEIVERAQRIAAIEATAAGIHWTFGPMVDIARDPRWGRIAEGSGEDPFLGCAMAGAQVRGFQGKTLTDPTSLLACAKHFAAYGGAEGGRDYNTVDISERTLRDVYLPPFKSAVDAGAGTLMASFNEIAGVPSSGNRHLLTEILREEWKFDGFVVSDWQSISEMRAHRFAANDSEAAFRALHAGVDMDMMGSLYLNEISRRAGERTFPQAEVDEAVRRILRIKFRLGLFDDPYKQATADREKAVTLTAANLASARDVARRSIVLLKNDGHLLPLKKTITSIAVVGPLAADTLNPLGPWHARGDARNVVSFLSGIKNALPAGTHITYAKGCQIDSPDTSGFAEAVAAANHAEVIILVVGEASSMSGEASSRSSIGLPGVQEDLVRSVVAAGKPVVLVLMNGRPLAIPWEAAHVPAILETWFLGLQTGNAIADVVFGDYNPSGKLPASFPRVTGQIPIYYNYKSTGRPYNDTIHFTSKYFDLSSTPLYPFGFGLSYTTFAYSGLNLSGSMFGVNDTLTMTVTVKNTGAMAGEEVVQVYVRDDFGSVTRPVKELKAFQKIKLEAGQARVVTLHLPIGSLAFTTLTMQHRVEPGSFTVFAGPSSAEGIEAKFSVKE